MAEKRKNILHKNLFKLRTKQKLTQQELVDDLEKQNLAFISAGVYGHYERGASQPSIDILIGLADYFKTSIDLLVTREL